MTRKLIFLALFGSATFLMGRYWQELSAQAAEGGGAGGGAVGNGDVNGSGVIDISDASYLLNWLFLGGPEPSPCPGGSGLPDTGQTQCFDCSGQPCEGFIQAFLGLQDGFLNTGCPNDASRFTVNGDGTVTDNCTGLMWTQAAVTLDGDALSCDSDVFLHWCEALAACANLNFAGHDDWRLPNVRELQSLIDYGRDRPSISAFLVCGLHLYWSSTSFVGSPASAWTVDFSTGIVEPTGKGPPLGVARAVRGG